MPDTITLPLEELKALFDIGTSSMSFGSGFLDTDEVNTLRRIAARIGVDPMEGTPGNFTKEYPHLAKPDSNGRCRLCAWGRSTVDAQHMEAGEYAAYVRGLAG